MAMETAKDNSNRKVNCMARVRLRFEAVHRAATSTLPETINDTLHLCDICTRVNQMISDRETRNLGTYT